MAAKDAMSLQSSSRGDEVGIDQARSDGIKYSHTTENDMRLQEVVVQKKNRMLQVKKSTFAYVIRKPAVAFFLVFFYNITWGGFFGYHVITFGSMDFGVSPTKRHR